MKTSVRILARVIVLDSTTQKVLLVHNKDAAFWSLPGGGWEAEHETILEVGRREVLEETGLDVTLDRFLYLHEFHHKPGSIFFETVWLAHPTGSSELNPEHKDHDPNGEVIAAKWFSREELQTITVYPQRLQGSFWDDIKNFSMTENPFIGVTHNKHP